MVIFTIIWQVVSIGTHSFSWGPIDLKHVGPQDSLLKILKLTLERVKEVRNNLPQFICYNLKQCTLHHQQCKTIA